MKIEYIDTKLAPETMEFHEWQKYLMRLACSAFGVSEAEFNEKLKLDIDRLHKVHFTYSSKRRFGHTLYACMCVLGYMDVLNDYEVIPVVLPKFDLITHFLNTLSQCMLLYSGERFVVREINHKNYTIETSKFTRHLKFYTYETFRDEVYKNNNSYSIQPIIDYSKLD